MNIKLLKSKYKEQTGEKLSNYQAKSIITLQRASGIDIDQLIDVIIKISRHGVEAYKAGKALNKAMHEMRVIIN